MSFSLNNPHSPGDQTVSHDPEVPGGGGPRDARARGAGVGGGAAQALRPPGLRPAAGLHQSPGAQALRPSLQSAVLAAAQGTHRTGKLSMTLNAIRVVCVCV